MLTEQSLLSLSDKTFCDICNGRLISDPHNNEKICSSCGVVNYNIENTDANGRNISPSVDLDYISSVGESTSLTYGINLPTFIDSKNVDANGKLIHGHSEIERLRKLNKFTISSNSRVRNLMKAIKEIQRITEILCLSSTVAERACYIYKKALNQGLIKGRSISGIATATIYIACKEMNIPFSLDKTDIFLENTNKKSVVYYYKFLLRSMGLNVGVPAPTLNISRIAERARLSGKTERKALEILSQIHQSAILSGKKPVSLAAAALYLASLMTGDHATQLRIAVAAELTTITIRKRAAEIAQILNEHMKPTDKEITPLHSSALQVQIEPN